MVEYKLTVVKISTGGFAVNHYYKVPDIEVPDMEGVIAYMVGLKTDVRVADSTLVGLSDSEVKTVMDARGRLIREGLEGQL